MMPAATARGARWEFRLLVLEKKRWLGLLFVLRGSTLPKIWMRLCAVTIVAVAVTVLHQRHGYFEVGLTTTPFSLIALALGIFLGFRNNTSYDRFWEGRKLWGSLVNTSRSLARQITMLIGAGPEDDDAELRAVHRELVHRLVAYVHAFRHHLRGEELFADAKPFLPAEEATALAGESNVPVAILDGMARRFRQLYDQGRIHAMHLPVLEDSLTQLTNIQGGCERIRSTPIPSSYTVLIHRLVATYVFALPFGLVNTVGVFTPEVTFLVAYAFLGLDAIGDEIEEPFGHQDNDLPLTTLSRMIEVNVRQRVGDSDLPPLLGPDEDGFLH